MSCKGCTTAFTWAAPDLLGAAALGERRDGANGLRVRLLLQDRLEVAVQAAELGGERLLRRRAPRGHSLRRLSWR